MKTTLALSKSSKLPDVGARRRFQEFSLIFRDPVLFMSLLFSGIFIFVFVLLPILRTISGGFLSEEGNLDLSYFARYFDSFYGPGLRRAFLDTMIMGLLTAVFGIERSGLHIDSSIPSLLPRRAVAGWSPGPCRRCRRKMDARP